jgi:hypothetical protein
MTLAGVALLRSSGRRRSLTALLSALVIGGTLAASPAGADEGTPALRAGGDPDEGGVPPPVTVPVPEPGPLDPSETT